jgi:hypothetical protein
MKTRRNRKNRRGGAGEGFFSNIGKALGLNTDKKSENGQPMEAQGQPEANGQPEAQGQPIQEAVPIDPNDPKVDAAIKADVETPAVIQATALIGAGQDIDTEVAKLTEEEGYYFRAFINAISVCNSTMKMKHNLLNPLDAEAFVCGEQCHKRADIIRKTIERLIPYLQRSDALGYISTGRGLVNSGTYLFKSLGSLGSKGASGLYNAPAAIASAPSAIGNSLYNAPTSIFNAAIKARDNITTSVNALDKYTKRAPVNSPGQPAQIQGGRRRTRRRR